MEAQRHYVTGSSNVRVYVHFHECVDVSVPIFHVNVFDRFFGELQIDN